ncbi:protocadherin Fat 4-like [Crassostrea virginica]
MDASKIYSEVTYKLLNHSDLFNISENGELTVVKAIDFDAGHHHFFVTARAFDRNNHTFDSTCIVYITIEDINDTPPKFDQPAYKFELSENQPSGTVVGRLSANDSDSDSLHYAILGKTQGFNVNSSTGIITSIKAFDYETENTPITINCTVDDTRNSGSVMVTVIIKDMNDNAPIYNSLLYKTYIKENTQTGVILRNISASDKDKGQALTYTLLNDFDGLFYIDSKTAQLSINNTNKVMNFNKKKYYLLQLEVTDDGQPPLKGSAIVEVHLIDIDNTCPEFTRPVFHVAIQENKTYDDILQGCELQELATDVDTDANKLVYSVVNNTNFKFEGHKLKLLNELDADGMRTSVNLTIKVNDKSSIHSTPCTSTSTIRIKIENINDNPPVINAASCNKHILQNFTGSLCNISATDADVDDIKGAFTFFFNHTYGHFIVDFQTGEVKVGNGNLVANTTYNITVAVSDHGSPPLISMADFSVTIDISNHYPPVFSNSSVTVNIKEKSGMSFPVYTMTATDQDNGKEGIIKYTIVQGNTDVFSINESTGEITLKTVLICDPTEYVLRIKASDQGFDPKSATGTVTIKVENVNDNPVFENTTYGICVNPPLEANLPIAKIIAKDPDYQCTKNNSDKMIFYSLLNHTDTFDINEKGEIYTRKNWTNPSNDKYINLTVEIKDFYGGKSNKIITISPGSEGDPIIRPKVTDITINETYNGTITKINATGEGKITYKIIQSSIKLQAFSINNDTGELSLLRPLDREQYDRVSLIVEAYNQNCNCSCTSQVIIHIEDVNDNLPFFIGTPYKVSIEEEKSEQCIQKISASDKDEKDKLYISIIPGNWSDHFNLTPSTTNEKCLNLWKKIDAEEISSEISLGIKITDGIHVNETYISISILDVNDHPPKFKEKVFSFEVPEDTVNAKLGYVSATDKDKNDKLKFKIVDKNQSQPFALNPATGELTVEGRLDRENKPQYTFNVSVEDSWKNHTDIATVHVAVLDVNDNPPTFQLPANLYNVTEGSNSTKLRIPLRAKDPDKGMNGTVTFKLKNDYDGQFKVEDVHGNNGSITILKDLDYEAKGIPIKEGKAVYTLDVVASDKGNPPLNSTTKIEIYVTDINDCSPEFKELNMSATVMEGSRRGFLVYRVTATDCDYHREYRKLEYSLSGEDVEYFDITKKEFGGQQEGWVTLEKQISVDNKTVYEVMVTVTDGLHTNQTSLQVIVEDVNDHDPTFTQSIYNFNITENDDTPDNVTVHTPVGQVNATDLDLTKTDLSYRIVTSDVGHIFSVTQDGEIYLVSRVDHDNCSSHKHSFTVVAEDTGSPKRMGFTEVVVTIVDENDNYPEFQTVNQTYVGHIQENSPNGSRVVFNQPISAKDKDGGLYGTDGIVYSILPDVYNSSDIPFTIDDITGEITVCNSEKLDWEVKKEFKITVEAKDNEGSLGCHSSTVQVVIKVKDENDNPPVFDSQNYTFSISEDASYGTFVGGITATDPDFNPQLTYYIQSGADGHFLIADKTSGNITVGDRLDRETQSNYTINVTVTDGPHSESVEVLIELSDVNDNPPRFNDSLLEVDVVEECNCSYPFVIYTVTATDKDEGENKAIEYFLNHSSSGSRIATLFNLSKDGDLYLNEKLDREQQDEYNLFVYAVDGGTPSLTSSATIRISVEDINDNYPVFYDQNNHPINESSASILEMSPIKSIIYVPICRDQDEGMNGTSGIKYDINCQISDGEELLDIDETSGTVYIKNQVSLNVLLHNENNTIIQAVNGSNQAVIIPCTITATDGGEKSSHLTLDLTVENINDNAPVFQKPFYVFNITENAKNDLIGKIDAIVINKTFYHLTYSMIEHSDVSANVSVKQDGSIHTKGVLDRETKTNLTFAAKVVDGRVPERTAYTVVTITLDDVNDNSPEFNQSDYQYFVIENDTSPPPMSVYAFDKDIGENAEIVYILTGNETEKFTLNATTGILTVNSPLDRETTPFLYMQITARDKGNPPRSSSVNLTVIVLDINDNNPTFGPALSQLTTNVTENQSGIQIIAKVKAEDSDAGLNGTVVYSLEPEQSLFQIDSLNGSVFCTRPLDYEEQTAHIVTILATDLGSPSRTAAINLTVLVMDVPDDVPTFNQSLYEATASINDNIGKSVLSLHAGDQASYRIIDGNQETRFKMYNETGEVTVYRSLAFGKPEYLLEVEARDKFSNRTAATKVLVHIADFNKVGSSQSQNVVKVPENINKTTFVADLSKFTQGSQVEYSIKSVIPNEYDDQKYFYINGSGLYCNHSLDREKTEKITLIIHYKEKPFANNRLKRSVFQNSDLTLVIEVTDTNDNPPCFKAASKQPPCFSNSSEDSLVFGVPKGAKPGDLVGVIQAVDPDSSSEGHVRYNITGGDVNTFYIHPSSGQIFLRRTVYQDHRDNYTLTVTAADQDGKVDTAKISVLVVPSGNSMILTVPGLNDQIIANKRHLQRQLETLTGLKFEIEKSTPHTKDNQIDLCSSDVVFHCINLTTNFVVLNSFVKRVVIEHTRDITQIFCQFLNASSSCQQCKNVTVEKIPLQHSAKMSAAEIALIAISALMLLGAAALIAILLATPTSNKEEDEKRSSGNVDMWELESLKSSTVAKEAINPMFSRQDEDMNQSSQMDANASAPAVEISTRRKSFSEESQEVVMDFHEDDCFDGCNDVGNHQMNHSNADSGVENESDSSRSESIQTENEQMESEGGPSSSNETNVLVINGNEEELSEHEKPGIFIAMDTGDTSDGEQSESSEDEGERNSNEVDDTCRFKGEEISPEKESDHGNDTRNVEPEESSPTLPGTKSVSFKPGPPLVEEYEAEEDAVTCL